MDFEKELNELNELYERLLRCGRASRRMMVMEDLSSFGDIGAKLELARKQYVAANRGIGLANKLKNPEDKKKHQSRVMSNLNNLRKLLSSIEKEITPDLLF